MATHKVKVEPVVSLSIKVIRADGRVEEYSPPVKVIKRPGFTPTPTGK